MSSWKNIKHRFIVQIHCRFKVLKRLNRYLFPAILWRHYSVRTTRPPSSGVSENLVPAFLSILTSRRIRKRWFKLEEFFIFVKLIRNNRNNPSFNRYLSIQRNQLFNWIDVAKVTEPVNQSSIIIQLEKKSNFVILILKNHDY